MKVGNLTGKVKKKKKPDLYEKICSVYINAIVNCIFLKLIGLEEI